MHYTLYIGCYGEHLLRYRLQPEKRAWAVETGRALVHHSSYLAQKSEYIFAITEAGRDSMVSSFGKEDLQLISRSSLVAPDPCYIICSGEHLLTANYTGANISIFPILAGGVLGNPIQTPPESGCGPEQRRQRASHIHSLQLLQEYAPNGEEHSFIVAADLGADRLRLYRADEIERLQAIPCAEVAAPAGSGPRHFAIERRRRMIYLLNEISGSILAIRYSIESDGCGGWFPKCSIIQEIATESTGAQASADIHLSPDGRFLYSSNRNIEDGILCFEIADDGRIERRSFTPTAKHPRNFAITPCGEYMIVACKNSRALQLFSIERESGALVKNPVEIATGTDEPVCIMIDQTR